MDKGEPSLVPEWLRSSGHSSSAGGNSNHLLISSSSSSHSDSASLPHNNSRNKNSRSRSDVDYSVHSPFPDRSSSWGASNGSAKHPYSSFNNFNRSQRDKDRGRDKDRVISFVDPWDLDTCIPPLRNILTGRDQDQLRRSHSMVTRKQADHLSRGLSVGLKNGGGGSYNGNGSIGNSFLRTGFDKDFPSLGSEEKHGGQDVVRVSSPGLGSADQSLPVGNSALIGGEGWTSALAEVPCVIDKVCAGPMLTSPKASIGSSSGLNMAEALVQAPARTLTPPHGSVKAQRHEDFEIKQSRQLIPVVPSAPKCSILNSSDKSKTKQMVRAGETCLASSRQHPSVLLGNVQSNPSGQIKSEKKLLVLKPARETGVAAAAVKESGSPSCSSNSRPNSSQPMNTAQSTQSATVRSTNSPREQKGITSFTMISGQTIEKKPSLAQTRSRHAFYSALKQKTISANISTDPVCPSTTCVSSSVEEKVNRSKELVASDPSSSQVTSGLEVTQRNIIGFEAADTPDEEEAEFLRSLGWDENNGKVEALTEEEIKAFNEQYNKLRPSLPQKLSITQEQERV